MNNQEMGVWENWEEKRPHSPTGEIRNPLDLVSRKGEVWDNGIRSPLLCVGQGRLIYNLSASNRSAWKMCCAWNPAQVPEKAAGHSR